MRGENVECESFINIAEQRTTAGLSASEWALCVYRHMFSKQPLRRKKFAKPGVAIFESSGSSSEYGASITNQYVFYETTPRGPRRVVEKYK